MVWEFVQAAFTKITLICCTVRWNRTDDVILVVVCTVTSLQAADDDLWELFWFVIYSNKYDKRAFAGFLLPSRGEENPDKLNINTVIMVCCYIKIILRCQEQELLAFIIKQYLCMRGTRNYFIVRQIKYILTVISEPGPLGRYLTLCLKLITEKCI